MGGVDCCKIEGERGELVGIEGWGRGRWERGEGKRDGS